MQYINYMVLSNLVYLAAGYITIHHAFAHFRISLRVLFMVPREINKYIII